MACNLLHITILGITITTSSNPANVDNAKFIDVLENILEFLDDDFIEEDVCVCRDRYDVRYMRHGITTTNF